MCAEMELYLLLNFWMNCSYFLSRVASNREVGGVTTSSFGEPVHIAE